MNINDYKQLLTKLDSICDQNLLIKTCQFFLSNNQLKINVQSKYSDYHFVFQCKRNENLIQVTKVLNGDEVLNLKTFQYDINRLVNYIQVINESKLLKLKNIIVLSEKVNKPINVLLGELKHFEFIEELYNDDFTKINDYYKLCIE